MDCLKVHFEGKPIYDIILDQSFDGLAEATKSLDISGKKLCIVTDSTVATLYLKEVKELLSQVFSQVDAFVFPQGEEQKNLNTVRDVYRVLIEK